MMWSVCVTGELEWLEEEEEEKKRDQEQFCMCEAVDSFLMSFFS